MKNRWTLSLLSACLVLACGAAETWPEKPTAPATPASPDLAGVVYAHLAKQKELEGKNFVFSPLSLKAALAMAAAGAKGETKAELEKACGAKEEEMRKVCEGILAREKEMEKDKGLAGLRLRSALQLMPGCVPQEAFVDLLKKSYGLTFGKLEGRPNRGWEMVLTQTLSFRGNWGHTNAYPDATDGVFTTGGKEVVQVPMLSHPTKDIPFAENKSASMVELPYAGDIFGLYLVLPKDGMALDVVSQDTAGLSVLAAACQTHLVDLSFPKFCMESNGHDFIKNGVAEGLGVVASLDDSVADFSGIADATLYIAEIGQDVKISVDEDGTQAEARTWLGIFGEPKLPRVPKATFHANRPFLFLLRDKTTGEILFMGRMMDPREAKAPERKKEEKKGGGILGNSEE